MIPMSDLSPTAIVCDGNWHDLVLTKTGIIGEISVDGVLVATGSAALPANFLGVDTYAPLYFGGVPGM